MFQLRGLGETEGEDRGAAAAYCGTKFGTTSPNFQPCVDFYANSHTGEYAPNTGSAATSAIAKKFNINLIANKIDSVHWQQKPESLTDKLMPTGVPWYKTPLGIGAIVLAAFIGYRQLGR